MLKDLQINTNNIEVEYPRFKSFKLKMCYIPRDEVTDMRDKAVSASFNRLERRREEKVDTDKFMDAYIKRAIVGWSGLTYEIVTALVPVTVDEAKLHQEISYSHDDAMWLVKNSSEFDSFVTDTMNQVDLFSSVHKEEQLKK